jgi:hypothetical protein
MTTTDTPERFTTLRCPKCRGEADPPEDSAAESAEIVILEDATFTYSVSRIYLSDGDELVRRDPRGVLKAEYQDSDSNDENSRFYCCRCSHEWPVPKWILGSDLWI